ncbi:glycosyltransferase [Candidatus Clostridium stratigraminis]|uniref:Glycosyltransferase n=1 Tax=Candidatus Clostridium stratigraminis TaxID=3381661 RepID=A0ABW8T4A2_9CLOT
MNVLIISSWYPSKDNYISGIFVYEQVMALKKVGLNPIVFYPFDKSIEKNKLLVKDEDGIITYRSNTDYMRISKISTINSLLKSLKFLDKIVMENNIDLIHSHVCYTAGFITALYNKFYKKIPFIITEHSSKIGEFSQRWYNRKLFAFSYKNASKVVTVSKSLEHELRDIGYNFKSEIIGNVVNTDDFSIKYSKEAKDEFKILFIGLMGDNEVKGIQYLLPAIRDFIKNHTNYKIKLTLVGGGSKLDKYKNLSKDLSIENYCEFKGNVHKEEIKEFIKDNDFLVLPSVKETFGSVLIESMSGGKPVLATKCGGPEEFVVDTVGILVEPKEIAELENGILYMIENYDKFNSQIIRKYALDNFSYEAIGNKLKLLYINVSRIDGGI